MVGATAIRAAFEAIFANGAIAARPEKVRRLQTMNCAVHSVLERIEIPTDEGPQAAWVVATNVYVKSPQGWRMVAHHASPATSRDPGEFAADQSTPH